MTESVEQNQSEFDEHQSSAIGVAPKINLSSIHSTEIIYSFEEKNKIDMLKKCFDENRFFVNPQYRNCLSTVLSDDVLCNDIVVYKTKEYRYIGEVDGRVLARNSKKMITINKEDMTLKIKDLDGVSVKSMYDLLRNIVDNKIFDDHSFFLAFLAVFDVDGEALYKSLTDQEKKNIKRGMMTD